MSSRQSRRLRFRFQGRQVGVLTVVWLALVGEVNLVTVVGGVLIGWLITVIFPMTPVHYYGRPHPWGVVKLAVAVLADLAASSWRLAIYAFTARPISSAIVKVDVRVTSDLYQVNVAELVSIVPGTIVVDTSRHPRSLFLHVFDLPEAGGREAVIADTLRVERRLVTAFGSKAELAALDDKATPRVTDERRPS